MGIVDTPFYVRNGFGYDRGFQDFLWLRGQGDARRMEERLDARATWRHESDRWVARTVTAAEEWLERNHRERSSCSSTSGTRTSPGIRPSTTRVSTPRTTTGARPRRATTTGATAGLTEDDVRLSHATYAGEVTMVDRWVGRLVEKLDLLGIADDTVLVFVSDHGYYFGEHGFLGKSVWDAELGTQSWSPLYREIVEVPLFVRDARRRAAAHARAHDARRRAGNDSRPRRRRRRRQGSRVARSRPSSAGRRTSIASSS